MTDEVEQNLQQNIQKWLDQKPSNSDILEYTKHLPEDDKYILALATYSFARILYFRLDNYCIKRKIPDFSQKIVFIEQLNILEGLQDSTLLPVIIQEIKQKFPLLNISNWPADIQMWAKDFMDKWNINLHLATVDDYTLLSFYLQSFIVSFKTNTEIKAILSEWEKIYLDDGQKYDLGEDYSDFELEKIKIIFKKLKFLPEEFIDKTLNGRNFYERSLFIFQILTVLYFLKNQDIEQANLDLNKLKLSLWDYLSELKEKNYSQEIEKIRLENYSALNQEAFDELLTFLDSIWTKEKILSGETRRIMISYLSNLSLNKKKSLQLILNSYFEDLPLFYTLFPSGAMEYILNLVYNSPNLVGVENISESLNKAIPDVNKHKLVTQLLQTIYEVTEALKPSHIHLTNHYA